MSNLTYTYVPVEVSTSSPDGNFEILRHLFKNLFSMNCSIKIYLDFGTTKTLILHARSIFFKGCHLTKIWSKNIFHENPVKVRSFDLTYHS